MINKHIEKSTSTDEPSSDIERLLLNLDLDDINKDIDSINILDHLEKSRNTIVDHWIKEGTLVGIITYVLVRGSADQIANLIHNLSYNEVAAAKITADTELLLSASDIVIGEKNELNIAKLFYSLLSIFKKNSKFKEIENIFIAILENLENKSEILVKIDSIEEELLATKILSNHLQEEEDSNSDSSFLYYDAKQEYASEDSIDNSVYYSAKSKFGEQNIIFEKETESEQNLAQASDKSSQDFENIFSKLGMKTNNVPSDGNCFFHAVSHQLSIINSYQLTVNHKELRNIAINYIKDHKKDFQNFAEEEINTYINNMSRNGNWADNSIILALSRALSINIVIIQHHLLENPIILGSQNYETTIYLGHIAELQYVSLMPQMDDRNFSNLENQVHNYFYDNYEGTKSTPAAQINGKELELSENENKLKISQNAIDKSLKTEALLKKRATDKSKSKNKNKQPNKDKDDWALVDKEIQKNQKNKEFSEISVSQKKNIKLIDELTEAIQKKDITKVRTLVREKIDISQETSSGYTLLSLAIELDAEQIAIFLIEKGADINRPGSKGFYPISLACYHGNENILNILIKKGANVNQLDKDGKSPIYSAILQGHDNIVSILLDSNADPNIESKDGLTPLYAAILRANYNWAQILVKADVNKETSDGLSLLQNAIKVENAKNADMLIKAKIEKIVDMLITAGANIHKLAKNGSNLLLIAVIEQNFVIVQKLLEAGAKMNIANTAGITAFGAANTIGNLTIQNLLLDAANKQTSSLYYKDSQDNLNDKLILFASKGEINFLLNLLNLKLDINYKDNRGCTALIAAIINGHTDAVRMLLDYGADANQITRFIEKQQVQTTPLKTAIGLENQNIVDMLIQYGANINESLDEYSPLLAAISIKNIKIIGKLLKAKADFNKLSPSGTSPLIFAIDSGNHIIVAMLLKAGAQVNKADQDGRYPLLAAIEKNNFKTIQILIKNNADLNVKNREGLAAFDIARKSNTPEIIKLLEDTKLENHTEKQVVNSFAKIGIFEKLEQFITSQTNVSLEGFSAILEKVVYSIKKITLPSDLWAQKELVRNLIQYEREILEQYEYEQDIIQQPNKNLTELSVKPNEQEQTLVNCLGTLQSISDVNHI